LCSPIDLDIEATPQASTFVKAIESCKQETAMYLTKGGRLAVQSGPFRAHIDCFDDASIFDSLLPEGTDIPVPANFMEALETLEPFIGIDASRSWAMGVLFKDGSATTTNNIVVIQYWLGDSFPVAVNIPSTAVKEILRIGQTPLRLTVGERTLTAHYDGDRWMRTQLLDTDTWPNVDPLLSIPCDPVPFPPNFFESVATIAPFTNDTKRIFIRGNHIRTEIDEDAGAGIACGPLPTHGAFNSMYLLMLRDVADRIDFTTHPKPCGFRGHNVRGIIQGMYEE
jgi:hypothetical protein